MTENPLVAAGSETAVSATRFSMSTLRILTSHRQQLESEPFNPEWASEGESATALLAAADEIRGMLAPASRQILKTTLQGLRSATLLRDEETEEAIASFKLLRVQLSDVPADILQEACRRYVNVPGTRFFPRSAGELRTFINPLLRARALAEYRVRKMAQAAAERDRRAHEDANTRPWTVEEMRSFGRRLSATALKKGWVTRASFLEAFPDNGDGGEPEQAKLPPGDTASAREAVTAADYQALGLSGSEAAAALAEREALLARGRAPTIGDLLDGLGDAGGARDAA